MRVSYTFLAPFYDSVMDRAFAQVRAKNLASLPRQPGCRIFLNGIGTGLDLAHLWAGPFYAGLDLTRAMLVKAKGRGRGLNLSLVEGDGMVLPFADQSFDHAVLHLILAIVPDPVRCLEETARVTKKGGSILVLDKFLKCGQRAPVRRLLSPLTARLATRLDCVFEEALSRVPRLRVVCDQPALLNGWFRSICLERV